MNNNRNDNLTLTKVRNINSKDSTNTVFVEDTIDTIMGETDYKIVNDSLYNEINFIDESIQKAKLELDKLRIFENKL